MPLLLLLALAPGFPFSGDAGVVLEKCKGEW